MPSPFFVDPTMGTDPNALSGLGQALRVNRLEREQADKQKTAEANQLAMKQEVTAAVQSGDPSKMAEIAIKYPEMQKAAESAFGFTNDATKKIAGNTYNQVLSDPENAVQYLTQGIQQVTESGGTPSTMTNDLKMFNENPEAALKKMENGFAVVSPEGHKAYVAGKPEKEQTQLGSGAMSGYIFTESEGYTIDPTIKAALDKDAANKSKKKGMLNSKDVAGVNDKVTALTKDAVAINDSAKSLAALNETSTPTDQLAAIFKFMKSLDPTSVVREGEQNMAKRTGGPADAFVGFVSQIQGEGGLTPQAFGNMVNTSISLANSAVDSSTSQLQGYLNVLSDKINPIDLEKMQARAPQKIESIGVDESKDDLAVKWANENPNDPRAQQILNAQGK